MTEQIKNIYLGGLTAKRGPDGYMYVKGLATDDTLDLDQQICDPEWLSKAMPKWMEIGNIREMHASKAVGKATEMEQTGTGFVVQAKVVDEQAAKMVEEGVYTGFSVGIKGARVVKDASAPGGRIVDGQIVEVSLVDRPANPSCVIEIAKSVDGELVKGVAVDEKFASGTDINTEMISSEVPVTGERAPLEPRSAAFQPCSVCGGSGHKANIDANALTEIRCERCGGSGEEPIGEHEQILQDSPSNPSLADDINHEIKSAVAEAVAEAMKRAFSDKERADAAEAGQALPDGSYPIKTVGDLKNAIQSYGRASDKAKVKEHIIARAKALGKEELIPDNWKGADADLTKADDMVHDPAQLSAVRAGLIALIKAELDEMLAGTENEIADVSQLVVTLSMFLDWWTGEASENETDAPFTGWDDDEKPVIAGNISLGATVDIVKTVVAEIAADEKTELREELRKALGVDEEMATTKAALAEAHESVLTLKAALDEIREMAAPGGPALRQTQVQSNKSARVTALQVQAESLRMTAASLIDPQLRNQYLAEANKLDAEAETL